MVGGAGGQAPGRRPAGPRRGEVAARGPGSTERRREAIPFQAAALVSAGRVAARRNGFSIRCFA